MPVSKAQRRASMIRKAMQVIETLSDEIELPEETWRQLLIYAPRDLIKAQVAENAAEPEADKMVVLASKVMSEGWRNLLETNIPGDENPRRVVSYKRFWYAGAKHVMDALIFALDEGMDPTPADLSKVDGVYHEIRQFFSDVAAGKQ